MVTFDSARVTFARDFSEVSKKNKMVSGAVINKYCWHRLPVLGASAINSVRSNRLGFCSTTGECVFLTPLALIAYTTVTVLTKLDFVK